MKDVGACINYAVVRNGRSLEFYFGTTLPTEHTFRSSSTTLIPLNNWIHVAMTFEFGDANSIKMYANGQQVAGSWVLGTGSIAPCISNADLNIGMAQANGYHGRMDEIRIYDRVLSATEVETLYQWAPGPIGQWRFDDMNGLTAYDSSGNGNNGTLINGVEWGQGKHKGAVKLTAADSEYLNMGNPNILRLGATTDSYSWSAWVNLQGNNFWSRILAKGQTGWGVGRVPYKIAIEFPGAEPECLISDGTNNTVAIASSALPENTWYHLACVRDVIEDELRLYINGILAARAEDITVGSIQSSEDVVVGTRSASKSEGYPDALIDEIRIYGYVRTQEQILDEILNENLLIGHWKLDETSGTTAFDTGPLNNHLTLLNGLDWTSSGKNNGALDLETVVSQSAKDTRVLMPVNNNLSLAAWIKPTAVTAATDYFIAGSRDFIVSQYGDEVKVSFGNNNYEITTAANLQIGNWYHVLVTYDHTTQNVIIYVDGNAKSSSTIGTIPSSLQLAEFFVGGMELSGTYEYMISAPENDAVRGNTVLWEDTADFAVGKPFSAHDGKRDAFMRFTDISIPIGANIDNAYFELNAYANTAANADIIVNTIIKGEDADDPNAVSSVADWSARTKTTASVAWNAIPAWTDNVFYQSPDISSILQEIIDRPGWETGNALNIFWEDNGSTSGAGRISYAFEGSSILERAKLVVDIDIAQPIEKFSGIVDEVKLYNAILTPEQVLEEYNP